MKKLAIAALLLAVTLTLAACGGAGSGGNMQGMDQNNMQGSGDTSGSRDQEKSTGGMSGMQGMEGMDHGSMDMGSGGMAQGMLMENGEYSDERFIDAMVPHHQGAVDMAEVALGNAEHQEIEELSRNIIRSQEAEIRELKAIKREEFGTSRVPMDMSEQEMGMMGMMDPQQLVKQRPFDKAFIDAMIPHHESAIDMANVAVEKTDNPRISSLANNIIEAQRREIEQMNRWREEWYPRG